MRVANGDREYEKVDPGIPSVFSEAQGFRFGGTKSATETYRHILGYGKGQIVR